MPLHPQLKGWWHGGMQGVHGLHGLQGWQELQGVQDQPH